MKPVVLTVLMLAVAVWGDSSSGEGATDELHVEEELIAPSHFLVSRHLKGRWGVTWTSGCTRRQTIGSMFIENETSQFFAWRDSETYDKFDYDVSGEGTTLHYFPFLKNVPRPKLSGVRTSYGYQLCTTSKHSVETVGGDDLARWGPQTEVRVSRGFVYEVQEGADVLSGLIDRCVDGLNRNYNLILTTLGTPITDEEATTAGPTTHNIRVARWVFRLPGNVKCEESTQPTVVSNSGEYDRAADNAFDVMMWTRTELPVRSFWESHFSMIVFAGLFIAFRVFTTYRIQSKRIQNQQTLMRDVTKEVAENKSAFLDSVKKGKK